MMFGGKDIPGYAERFDALVRDLGEQVQPPLLSPARREQVLRAAFRAARSGAPKPERTEHRLGWPLATLMATCAIVGGIGLGINLPRLQDAPRTTAPVASVDRVIWGDVAPESVLLSPDARGAVALRSRVGAVVQLGPATVELAPETSAAWLPATSTLRLDSGSAQLVVAPTRTRPFLIETDRFVVEVIGTVLRVDPTSVLVLSGRVRVLARDGSIFAPHLEAGETWTYGQAAEEAKPTRTATRTATPTPATTPAPAPGAPEAKTATATPAGRGKERPRRTSARRLVARAKRNLLRGDVEAARQAAEDALASAEAAESTADAQMVLAECAQAEGDASEAIRRYLSVASNFPQLQTGQAALFAAARLEVRAGSIERGRRLLRQYLHDYPGGALENDAAAMLRSIGGEP